MYPVWLQLRGNLAAAHQSLLDTQSQVAALEQQRASLVAEAEQQRATLLAEAEKAAAQRHQLEEQLMKSQAEMQQVRLAGDVVSC